MPKAIDLSGLKFSRLLVLHRDSAKTSHWVCLCDCGTTKSIYTGSLKSGATKSCGCLHHEVGCREPGRVGISHLYSRCRSNAASRNIEFHLSRQDFATIISKDCVYCGEKPAIFNPYCRKGETEDRQPSRRNKKTVERAWIVANGIDRIDNSQPYTVENSAACCPACNLSKSDRTVQDFIEHARRIVSYTATKEVLS